MSSRCEEKTSSCQNNNTTHRWIQKFFIVCWGHVRTGMETTKIKYQHHQIENRKKQFGVDYMDLLCSSSSSNSSSSSSSSSSNSSNSKNNNNSSNIPKSSTSMIGEEEEEGSQTMKQAECIQACKRDLDAMQQRMELLKDKRERVKEETHDKIARILGTSTMTSAAASAEENEHASSCANSSSTSSPSTLYVPLLAARQPPTSTSLPAQPQAVVHASDSDSDSDADDPLQVVEVVGSCAEQEPHQGKKNHAPPEAEIFHRQKVQLASILSAGTNATTTTNTTTSNVLGAPLDDEESQTSERLTPT